MIALETVMLSVLAAACIYFSYTDLKYNLIRNRYLLRFALAAGVMDLIYYIAFDREDFYLFAINVGFMTAISLVLYITHVWAAGDSKLLILIALLIPANITWVEDRNFYEFMIPVYAFAAGFLFLVGDTVNLLVRKKLKISKEDFREKFKLYMKQYVINCVYILTLLKIEDFVLRKFQFQLGFWQIIVNLCVLVLISYFPVFRKPSAIMLTLMGSALYSIGTGIWMMNLQRLIYYGIIVLFMILQILIGEFNYQVIDTKDVKPGMVLSFLTTMTFRNSRVKGLPELSSEDMRSRITPEEANAVKRWESSKYGSPTITIVRKIPFGIFISAGTLFYLLILVIQRFAF